MLHARRFLAGILAAATGMALYFRAPFPAANLFVHVMVIRAASAYVFFKDSYTLFLYTTPYIVYSVLLAALYIFALKATCKIQAGKLTLCPEPSETPHRLVIPKRGLFTGIAGLTSGVVIPTWQT